MGPTFLVCTIARVERIVAQEHKPVIHTISAVMPASAHSMA